MPTEGLVTRVLKAIFLWRIAFFIGSKMKMKVLVLVNGNLYQPAKLRKRVQAENFDMVIGADRGARHARTLRVGLAAVIGDLDSLTAAEDDCLNGCKLITFPAGKDETDLELALLYARDQGAERIVLVGVMGGRMDMAIGNILLINHAELEPCRVEIWHGTQTGWIIRPPGEEIRGRAGDTLSLLPLGGEASGINTEGLRYPLDNGALACGAVRGISNLMLTNSAAVRLKAGRLLAVHTPGRA
ncbi:MAG TPA: thiamine diphosphokinase [Dehalococcoidales bacterium]|nr:thiamine diphosphokinase [Dehalococcoidales bacterium]